MSNVIRVRHTESGKFTVKIKDCLPQAVEDQQQAEDLQEKLFEEKYAEGFSEGYAKAKSELENDYSRKLADQSERIAGVLNSFNDKVSSYDHQFEDLVIDISFNIASRIVNRELQKDSGIEIVLKEALKRILGANNVLVKLEPGDYELIVSSNKKQGVFDEAFSKMKFESDERIEKGGCIVESELGNVDARVSSRISELQHLFETNRGDQV